MYPIKLMSIPSTKTREILLFHAHFQPPCDSLGWMSSVCLMKLISVFFILHRGPWGWPTWHTVDFLVFWLKVQVRGNTSRIWKMRSESGALTSILASLLSGDGVIMSLNWRPEPLNGQPKLLLGFLEPLSFPCPFTSEVLMAPPIDSSRVLHQPDLVSLNTSVNC